MYNEKEQMITLCGDNCLECPRYIAKTDEELLETAKLWYKVGWRDKVVSIDEIRCEGCSSHKQCTYHLVECIKEHNIEKCNQCKEYPCEKIKSMLEKSKCDRAKCKDLCTPKEYDSISKAFFHKEENLLK